MKKSQNNSKRRRWRRGGHGQERKTNQIGPFVECQLEKTVEAGERDGGQAGGAAEQGDGEELEHRQIGHKVAARGGDPEEVEVATLVDHLVDGGEGQEEAGGAAERAEGGGQELRISGQIPEKWPTAGNGHF